MAADVIIRIKAEDLASGEIKAFRQELAKIKAELDGISRSNPFGTGGQGGGASRPFKPPVPETNRFGAALDVAKGNLIALSTEIAVGAVRDFATDAVDAAAKTETWVKSLQALHGNAFSGATEMDRLREIVNDPGLTFENITKGAIALKTVDVEGDRAVEVLKEIGNALALEGNNDLGGALLGLKQLLSGDVVKQEDLNQITERSGLIAKVLRDTFGSIKSEDIQEKLEQTGKSVQDFVDDLVDGLEKLDRAPTDTLQHTQRVLSNEIFLLKAAIGEDFSPLLKEATENTIAFISTLREWVDPEVDRIIANIGLFGENFEKIESASEKIESIESLIGLLERLEGPGYRAGDFGGC